VQLIHRADCRDVWIPDLRHQFPGRSVNEVHRVKGDPVEVVADVPPNDNQILGYVPGVPLRFERGEVPVEVVAVDDLPVGLGEVAVDVVPDP
jgi:hypothetical protein